MGTWNYRIVKYRNGSGFGLHEVYYDDKVPWCMTTDPISFATDEGSEIVVKSLCMALKDALQYPVFEEPEEWPERKYD